MGDGGENEVMNECKEFAFSTRAEDTLESRSGKGKRGLSP
jgi:hypothetical protein